MNLKTKPLNNPQDFKIPPKKIRATMPENEAIIGGDAPRVPKNTEFIAEVEGMYEHFLGQKFFGAFPNESGFKQRMRLHQGWWRAFVLHVLPGKHPRKDESLCNTILNGESTGKNFITETTCKIVAHTLNNRTEDQSGIMEKERLYNNLLSSQPLCFNFFAELQADKQFGLQVLKQFYPKLTKLQNVLFEYAPKENYTDDNSAFDVAFEVEEQGRKGLIGFECKYTDTFSAHAYKRDAYEKLYDTSNFYKASFDELVKSRTNQLFRNQLIADGLIQNKKYDFVYTGLFCYENDTDAIETAKYFDFLLHNETAHFTIVTYADFISKIQQLDITWKQREWSMLLWARYCALELSNAVVRRMTGK